MQLYDTLIDLLDDVRGRDRHIRFIEGERDESIVTFADLWDRAIALLGSLQSRGMQSGDQLVIFSKSNESFVVAFWAAMLGGIVPVPVAVGISDEHRSNYCASCVSCSMRRCLRSPICSIDCSYFRGPRVSTMTRQFCSRGQY